MMSQKRKDETMEAYVIRLVQEEERDRCAKIANDIGKHYGEAAIGSAIANAIRASTND